ncbi:hypothetical protein ACVNHC_12345 [Pannonibacter sp. Q-1]|uniref:IacB n=1 Tax=Pannonibacter phragmitetus TaxID=121719 RepID=A0A0L0IZI9_9HYPH|nr:MULTISPECIES: hypothetical protein [Pannonibacter]ALV28693.1 iacB [Pannonibacter phragmitetus]KND18758.1 iacB [Pannonibacter phragmitetus]MBA4204498.1 hypothetical protein [Polymorphum sp.]
MAEAKQIRTLLCIAVHQNFFDLPFDKIGSVWTGFATFMSSVAKMDGVTVLGTIDDDETMVGTSPTGFPWTCYMLCDFPDRDAVVAACNLFRTIQVGDENHRLWRYMRIEARMGRALQIPDL